LSRLLALAFLGAVGAVALTRAYDGHPTIGAMALTPDKLGSGHVWLLGTSAVVVNGVVLPQLIALVLTMLAALRRLGGPFVLLVMVVAHVGSTLLAYGALTLATGDADGAHNRTFDYGTSAVWLGLVGALTVALLPAARAGERRARIVVAAGIVCAAVAVAFFPLMSSLEHGFAFALGAGLTFVREWRRSAGRSAQSAASTAF
jgi:hypothetical protein